jgi:hypothetical protein
MMSEKPTLDANNYANLVTVFAVIVAVEYSSERYDAWDALIGIISIMLGYSFIKVAHQYRDKFYYFLTSSLISLGLLSVFNVAYYFITGCPDISTKLPEELFMIELKRVGIFLVLTLIITACIYKKPISK